MRTRPLTIGTLLLASVFTVACQNLTVDKNEALGNTDDAAVEGTSHVTITASFRCDNDSSFIATFPTMDSVVISAEGEENTIPAVPSESGQRFENDMWIFVFRGETVTVTTKALGSMSTCTQPFSSENAPVNFGD